MKYKIRLHEESNINDNFRQWFNGSKVIDSEGKPLKVYHGTRRPDRIGTHFNPKRATSGPMSYFTSDPAVASSYSTNKKDTSIEDETGYEERFRVTPKGTRSPRTIVQYWNYLDRKKQEEITAIAPYITQDEQDNIFVDKVNGGINSLANYKYLEREFNKNYLAILVDVWLSSGTLFNSEEDFMKVLALLNLPDKVDYYDPYASYPAVYPVYLSISNPLITSEISMEIKNALKNAGKRRRAKYANGVDGWDKNSQDPKVWLKDLFKDYPYVWTSIPDWVTEALKALGFNGILDKGNKGGNGVDHAVFIPFYSWQVKSVNNKGTWSKSSNKINENT